MIQDWIQEAREQLDRSQPQSCVDLLAPRVQRSGAQDPIEDLPALQLLGEAFLELGDPSNAYEMFKRSVKLDPTGNLGGFEKFLWLGQLSSGKEGINWFEKGVQELRRLLARTTGTGNEAVEETSLQRKKLCEALCGMIEIWMTDLWYVLRIRPII